MTKDFNKEFTYILEAELKPALGCTEPVAIAYAAANAVSLLGAFPDSLCLRCSGNIVKNVKGVIVPNSGGMKGIEAAAVLGALSNGADKKLEVLSSITENEINKAKELLKENICSVELVDDIPGLYIDAIAYKDGHSASATLIQCHDEIAEIKKDGVLLNKKELLKSASVDIEAYKEDLSVTRILEYANSVDISVVKPILIPQIELNARIAEEGLRNDYGCSIGKTLKRLYDWDDVRIRARAKASAGSDARMSGCALPVVINSGSGNQGLTVSLPVLEYAEFAHASEERTLRALVVSNLIAIHQKKYIGPLSAYCGAVSASAGASAGICYLLGGSEAQVADAISNTLAVVGGIVCDGAKASCAAKISTSLDAAIMAMEMSLADNNAFNSGEGLVCQNIESTIKAFGQVGKEGMRETDIEILHLMLENK